MYLIVNKIKIREHQRYPCHPCSNRLLRQPLNKIPSLRDFAAAPPYSSEKEVIPNEVKQSERIVVEECYVTRRFTRRILCVPCG